MNILFFAARQLHQTYFSQVAKHLQEQFPQHTASVMWHKTLWKNLHWLGSAKLAFKAELNTCVENHVREKQNSRKGRLRKQSYWPTFQRIKAAEAHILFAIYYSALKRSQATHMVIWNGLKFRQCIAIKAADALNIPCLYMENGLLPGMTTLDGQGINFRNSVPRKTEFFEQLDTQTFVPKLLEQLAKPLQNQFADKPKTLPKEYIFVPFQVNTDSQIVLFSPWIKNMMELVNYFANISSQLGDQMPHIVFKPHPACDQNYDALITQYSDHEKLHFDTQTPTPVLIQHANAVATINSTVGIESLLLNKKLITIGQAFYQLSGLTLNVDNQQALAESLQTVQNWQPEQNLRIAFFNYLATEYQLAGRWQDASTEHLSLCAMKVVALAEGL